MNLRCRNRPAGKEPRMAESIPAQIQALCKMTVAELREKHLELFGVETRSQHKDQLFKRLAWRIQELAYGGLSERARRRAEETANDLDARFLPPRKAGDGKAAEVVLAKTPIGLHPLPGTILTREYKGEVHQVTVLADGFEYQGQVYRSLSGVAKAITGTHWSGALFFGLKQRWQSRKQLSKSAARSTHGSRRRTKLKETSAPWSISAKWRRPTSNPRAGALWMSGTTTLAFLVARWNGRLSTASFETPRMVSWTASSLRGSTDFRARSSISLASSTSSIVMV
jgi:hypothetical protein